MLELGDARERRMAAIFIAAVVLIGGGVWLVRWWTQPPAIEFDNLRYIQLLTTAVSSRNEEQVSKVSHAVEERHRAGRMSATELGHFQRIIGLADGGDWSTADRECFTFAEAQLSRRRTQPPTETHDHSHDGHEHK
jgi:hypothetical protein